jgi:hypothetical protein
MRTLLELLVVAGLATATWEQSLHERLERLTGQHLPKPVIAPTNLIRYVAQPTPTPSSDWMWDPGRRSILDRPAYDAHEPSQRYLDAHGRTYWYDAHGSRHYDPAR